ncbi:SPW repeat protein [Streptomyces sp. NPDC006172]|uniref:SPW repeat protein n=1 Tax=Streptomyces sp. NPDC006172 TaxID=3154470 RepID=UPI0033C160FC
MTDRTHTTMESHPDILEMRERHERAERAASTQRGQAVEAMAMLTGLYLAASPWIAGFNGLTTLTVNNLITGIAYALLLSGFGHAYERTHARAWAAVVLGAWTVIAPWAVAGEVDTTRTVVNNVIVGLIALLLALAAAMAAGETDRGGRRDRSTRMAPDMTR